MRVAGAPEYSETTQTDGGRTVRNHLLIPDPLVSVPNFSWMVAILVHHHVPILDNGGTGLMDLGLVVTKSGLV